MLWSDVSESVAQYCLNIVVKKPTRQLKNHASDELFTTLCFVISNLNLYALNVTCITLAGSILVLSPQKTSQLFSLRFP